MIPHGSLQENSHAVTVHSRPVDTLSQAEIDRWNHIPVAIAVDVSNASCQIDPAIHPLCSPGRQPRLFGRAVTALCEPPDFGAVLQALDLIQSGDVLVIAANGHAETAMIGEILGGHLRRLGGRGIVCDGAIRDVAQLADWPDLPAFTRTVLCVSTVYVSTKGRIVRLHYWSNQVILLLMRLSHSRVP